MMERDFGLEFEYWPRKRLAEALSSPKYGEAFFNPYTFAVDPLALTRGLARAAETHGTRIYENSPAIALEIEGTTRSVRTPHGRIAAEHIVIAGGGYIGGLHRSIGLATVPIATFVMVTEPLGDRLRDAIRVKYAISDLTVATNYYRPLRDGRLLWGGRVLAWEPSFARMGRLLHRDMVSFYPALAGTQVEVAWSGLMPYTRHRLPVVGQIKKGVWYATGFGGLGLALTTMAGQMISAAIADDDDRWRLLSRFGLPYAGGNLGRIPAQMIYWYEQARSWLEAGR
jgi:gamma-glutamylputrescine oxidase